MLRSAGLARPTVGTTSPLQLLLLGVSMSRSRCCDSRSPQGLEYCNIEISSVVDGETIMLAKLRLVVSPCLYSSRNTNQTVS